MGNVWEAGAMVECYIPGEAFDRLEESGVRDWLFTAINDFLIAEFRSIRERDQDVGNQIHIQLQFKPEPTDGPSMDDTKRYNPPRWITTSSNVE